MPEFRFWAENERALDNFPALVWRCDESGQRTYFNQSWLSFAGITLEDAAGRGWLRVLHPADAAPVARDFSIAFSQRQPVHLEYRMRDSTGAYRWIIDFAHPILNDAGEFSGYMGAGYDITARREAEDELRKSRARYQDLVENINDVYYISDDQGRIIYASPSLFIKSGFSPESLLGQKYVRLVAPVDRRRVVDHYVTCALNGTVDTFLEFRVGRKDGVIGWIEQTTRLIRDAEGNVKEFRNIVRDITERKRYEEELIAMRKKAEELAGAKSAFLASMSHEIRTPLTGVVGFAQALVEEVTGDQKALAEAVGQSGQRLLETINSILELAHIESGASDPEPVVVSLGSILLETAELLMPIANQKNLSLRIKLAETDVFANIDPTFLRRVLNNLIGNALKFTQEGHVTVALLAERDQALITVQDTGIGIEPDFLPFIYDEFKRGRDVRIQGHEGGGLGLAITKRLVEKVGGTIHVESTRHRGTTFTVRLPRVEAPAIPLPVPARTNVTQNRPNGRSCSVLGVEDNKVACVVLKRFLEPRHRLELANDGTTALTMARAQQFDIVLMDINLGGEPTGLDTLRQLRALPGYEQIPCIAVTAYALHGDRERFLNAGFDGYISKPFARENLLAQLEEFL